MTYFKQELFDFLEQLAGNNNRPWFIANQDRYEQTVREPARHLVADLALPLAGISPHYVANPAKVGGSLYRIQRDRRYHRDRPPYKTWLGLRLYHERRRELHAPSFYVHLQPGECFIAAGLWRPESATIKRVREFIADNPRAWQEAVHAPEFSARFRLAGEKLVRAPRGYPPDHPLIDDLKRKDFMALQDFPEAMALQPDFADFILDRARELAPLVDYLCAALGLEF
ncbi:MAG: DUF2461 domain-containing protein [Lysobacterales bacterium]